VDRFTVLTVAGLLVLVVPIIHRRVPKEAVLAQKVLTFLFWLGCILLLLAVGWRGELGPLSW